MSKSELLEYYRKRAEEYEDIYQTDDRARQQELKRLAESLKDFLKGREVIEVACGTGYWTQFLSQTARSIVATDAAQEVIEVAKRKQYTCPVTFEIEDAYKLSFEAASFDSGLANFWFSHIPKSGIDGFLKEFNRVLKRGAKVFMADNLFVPEAGGPIIEKKGDENTYKLRKLKDGSEHLVLKNYFTKSELVQIFSRHVKGFGPRNVHFGKYFWSVSYQLQ